MDLHLRLLYSESAAKIAAQTLQNRQAPAETLAVLETFNFERLQVERRARHAQLGVHLGKQCASLWECLGEVEVVNAVAAFADSAAFWEVRGRTLTENFAVFARAHFESKGNGFVADLAELLGTLSAVMSKSIIDCPWPNHAAAPSNYLGCEWSETMQLGFDLIDESGQIRSQSAGGEVSPESIQHSVYRFRDGSCLIASERRT